MTKGTKLLISCAIASVACMMMYRYFSKEVVIFEKVVDDYGFKAAVTCRPDILFIYRSYVVIYTSEGLEVVRSQVAMDSYEALNACKNALPIIDIGLIDQRKKLRLRLADQRPFTGTPDFIDVPVSFFPP